MKLSEICDNLSMQCRFGGGVSRFYSVAEHTSHMVDVAQNHSPIFRLMLWLHDAPEYITGDQLPIIKSDPVISVQSKIIERGVMLSICHALAIDEKTALSSLSDTDVKMFDRAICAAEIETIARVDAVEHHEIFDAKNALHAAFHRRILNQENGHDFDHWSKRMQYQFINIMREIGTQNANK